MTTRTNPAGLTYWPGTHILKSQHTPFNWRSVGMDPRPLNADIQASPKPVNKGGRTGTMAFGAVDGTIKSLTREAKLLAARPPHVGFVIPKPSQTTRVRTIDNGYATVKVAAKNKTAPMHVIRPPHSKQKKAAA